LSRKKPRPDKNKYPYLFVNDKSNSKQKQQKYEKAWREAKKAAKILKEDYGAKEVFVFGSLTDKSRFHINSDIDLAETGIPDEKFYAAVGALIRLVKNFKVDLVDANDCKETLKKAIRKEGIKI
jgi:predicted nucleotidyltransferase